MECNHNERLKLKKKAHYRSVYWKYGYDGDGDDDDGDDDDDDDDGDDCDLADPLSSARLKRHRSP